MRSRVRLVCISCLLTAVYASAPNSTSETEHRPRKESDDPTIHSASVVWVVDLAVEEMLWLRGEVQRICAHAATVMDTPRNPISVMTTQNPNVYTGAELSSVAGSPLQISDREEDVFWFK